MVGNSNFVKMEKSRKEARKESQANKQNKQARGKTWQRTDKRAQQGEE